MKKKKLLLSNAVLADSEICPTHKPIWNFKPYQLKRRAKKKMRQTQCEVCKRWFFEDEM